MASENKLKYIRRWKSENTRQVRFECNVQTDADVLSRLDEVKNKAGYIKGLIRKDIAGDWKADLAD